MYYLSMEFLMGRSLLNTLYNLGIKDQYAGMHSSSSLKLAAGLRLQSLQPLAAASGAEQRVAEPQEA